MAEWTSVAQQTVNPGESIVFTENPVPCTLGLILHRDDSGAFLAKGISYEDQILGRGYNRGRNCGRASQVVNYDVAFGANIAIPTGETVQPISVAIAVDGATIAGTTMEETPAAAEEFANVSRVTNIPIWKGCCQTITVRNTSPIPILVENANIRIRQ